MVRTRKRDKVLDMLSGRGGCAQILLIICCLCATSCKEQTPMDTPQPAVGGIDSGPRDGSAGNPSVGGTSGTGGGMGLFDDSGAPAGAARCAKGGSCSAVGDTCDCGDDPESECQTVAECVDCCADGFCSDLFLSFDPSECQNSRQKLAWKHRPSTCNAACPSSIDAGVGRTCPTDGLSCPYATDISCYCTTVGFDQICGIPASGWYCGDYHGNPGCPSNGVPDIGTPCLDEGQRCIRGGGTENCVGDPYARACSGGVWIQLPGSNRECI
jgi:hypothetical protein